VAAAIWLFQFIKSYLERWWSNEEDTPKLPSGHPKIADITAGMTCPFASKSKEAQSQSAEKIIDSTSDNKLETKKEA